jgi:hypothetical protein
MAQPAAPAAAIESNNAIVPMTKAPFAGRGAAVTEDAAVVSDVSVATGAACCSLMEFPS